MNATGTILMYHRIAKVDLDPWGMCVTPENFAEQIHLIKKNGQVMALDELVDALRTGRQPKNGIVITFDDGYVDNLTHALPVLEEHTLRQPFMSRHAISIASVIFGGMSSKRY